MRNEEMREGLVNFPFSIDFKAFTRTGREMYSIINLELLRWPGEDAAVLSSGSVIP